MKVLFIYPNIHTPYSFSPAIQQLSAVLKKAGHETSLIHIHNEHGIPFRQDHIIERYHEIKPDLVCITSTTFEFKEANEIAKMIKGFDREMFIILGGIHATICPEDIKGSNFDAFCVGEGELPLLKLIDRLSKDEDFTDTKSFWFNHPTEGLIKNPINPVVDNLDSLPPFDMEIMDTKKLLNIRKGWLSVSFSRSCPFSCTFCINPLLRKITGGKPRKKSVDKVIEELISLIDRYGDDIIVFNFDDDLLMLDKKWMLDFCERYELEIFNKYHISYAINCRVDTLDEELTQRLKESGCQELQMGIESGNDYLRNTILKKGITKEQIRTAFKLSKKYNLKTNAYLMLGVPKETEETINETFDLINEVQPNLIRLTLLQPYIGTEIYDYCKKNKMFKGNKTVDCFTESPLKLSIEDDKLLKYKVMFPWYVNLRNKKIKPFYSSIISEFDSLSYSNFLKSFDNILEVDNQLSEKITKIPHYKYFNNNTYYFELKNER